MMRRYSGSCLAASIWPIPLAMVPPLKPPLAHRTAMIVSPSSPPAASRKVHARSDGIESNPLACTIRAPAPLATWSKPFDALAHEQDLPGEVGVVGAGLRTRLHQRQPVLPVGPDRRDQGLGRLGHRLQRRRIGESAVIRASRRPVRRGRPRVWTGSARPARSVPTVAVGQVAGNKFAGEAGRAEDNHEIVVVIPYAMRGPHTAP